MKSSIKFTDFVYVFTKTPYFAPTKLKSSFISPSSLVGFSGSVPTYIVGSTGSNTKMEIIALEVRLLWKIFANNLLASSMMLHASVLQHILLVS